MKIKQVIVINEELGMSEGQKCAQAAHSSLLFLVNRLNWKPFPSVSSAPDEATTTFTPIERFWLEESFTKIVVKARNTAQLLGIYENAKEAGLEAFLMDETDYLPNFPGKVYTALAVGPAPNNKLKPITGHLRLL